MKHAAPGGGGARGRGEGWPASSCRYYNVNASVNTPRDVFRKAWISRTLVDPCFSGYLYMRCIKRRFKGGGTVKDRQRGRKRGRWNTAQRELNF